MRKGFRFLALGCAVALIGSATSCKKDEKDPAPPSISNLEVGVDNNGEAHIGHDLHIDAEIVAEGKISVIEIELHAEEGEFDIDTVFTEFAGLKNADFHKHVEIPENTPEGHYHMHFIVRDQEGKMAEKDVEVHIEEGDGHEH